MKLFKYLTESSGLKSQILSHITKAHCSLCLIRFIPAILPHSTYLDFRGETWEFSTFLRKKLHKSQFCLTSPLHQLLLVIRQLKNEY